MPIRILIADDHGVLRAGLRKLLAEQEGFVVAGEAEDGPSALQMALDLVPDVLLLDLTLPGMSGIQVTRLVKDKRPGVRVLILTLHEDELLLRQAIESGASGYIVKRAVEAELIEAIRAVHRGHIYVHPSMTRALLKDLGPVSAEAKAVVEPLSPRELQVLRLMAEGHTNKQIAQALGLSVRTVEGHRANICGKLGLSSPIQVVRYAMEHGLLD